MTPSAITYKGKFCDLIDVLKVALSDFEKSNSVSKSETKDLKNETVARGNQ
jgi:hypothetical protein